MKRREFVGAGALVLLAGRAFAATQGEIEVADMYGLIGQMKATPGKRDDLIGYLLAGTTEMPGNLAYMIAKDAQQPDAIWITEVWRTKADHAASLTLPSVQEAISKARPILAGFGQRIETVPIGFD